MTKADAARLIAVMIKAYPNSDKYKEAEDVKATVNLWATVFASDPAEIVELAMMKHIQISKWPPSIAEIRENMMEIQHPDLIAPDEAWLAVTDLMFSRGEYADITSLLPPLVARAVDSIGYSAIWNMKRYRPGMERTAFMDIYKPLYERERQHMQLAPDTRQRIDSAAAALSDGSRLKLEAAQEAREEKEAFYHMIETGSIQHQLEAHNHEMLEEHNQVLLEESEEVHE